MLDRDTVYNISNQWEQAPFHGLCRFLAANEDQAAIIEIPSSEKNPMTAKTYRGPVIVSLTELVHQIRINNVTKADYDHPEVGTDGLSDSCRRIWEARKRIIANIPQSDEILFDQQVMLKWIQTQAKEHAHSERNLRRILYGYLAGGRTPLALVPSYRNCGGNEQRPGTARRGKKSSSGRTKFKLTRPEIKDLNRKGINKYLLHQKASLRHAYVQSLKEFFRRPDTDPAATRLEDILISEERRPSLGQFCYEYKRMINEGLVRRHIPGYARPREVEHERRGKATDHVPGPGFRFEIDATKLQIQLVSQYDRTKLIGAPSLYILVDVWSSAIVGYCLSIENFSWTMAAAALRNAFEEKISIFRRLTLPYTDKDWPCHHLPTFLTADRAELVSNKSGNVPKIGINVQICPPYRGDMKGTIEEKFNEIKNKRGVKLAGEYPKFRVRGEKDGKDDAVLTLFELEQILVEIILDLNSQAVHHARIPSEMVARGETDVSRIGLYTWGIEHKPGYTRTMTEQEVLYGLLTPGWGFVSREGIKFNRNLYRLQPGLPRALLGRSNTSMKVEVRLNEHDVSFIYFNNRLTNKWEQATSAYVNKPISAYEFDNYLEMKAALIDASSLEREHQKAERNRKIRKIQKDAITATANARMGTKTRKGKEAIRENRIIEKLVMRQQVETEPIDTAPQKTIADTSTRNDQSVKNPSVAEISARLWGKR
ncbi:hypothetical protein [Oryzomonas rubra]|uniref:Integrase catalytic domain-containing protein n=1 Tax=Oryzomonas rubra TaxID=2509454 RepID=A0A5A9XA10_9BACT|nr:hypothetical protein [Oryzomonas rubra]KAA0889836.1 hypothetical protein ET418_13775 [Oryzomonas rubra]